MTDSVTDFDTKEGINLLRSIIAHRDYLRLGLMLIAHDLEQRAVAHDLSKFTDAEFPGFARINESAREHPYGSEEYKAGLKQERPTINHHFIFNSHHPEFHEHGARGADSSKQRWGTASPKYASMGLLDLIEMVCDWRAAYLGYGSQGSWGDNILRQRERFLHPNAAGESGFSAEQWWVVEQVAAMMLSVDYSGIAPITTR